MDRALKRFLDACEAGLGAPVVDMRVDVAADGAVVGLGASAGGQVWRDVAVDRGLADAAAAALAGAMSGGGQAAVRSDGISLRCQSHPRMVLADDTPPEIAALRPPSGKLLEVLCEAQFEAQFEGCDPDDEEALIRAQIAVNTLRAGYRARCREVDEAQAPYLRQDGLSYALRVLPAAPASVAAFMGLGLPGGGDARG
jgi:hypothetical protein